MKIYETENYEEMSRKAANILSAQVILKPDCVLGLATGSTPIGTFVFSGSIFTRSNKCSCIK